MTFRFIHLIIILCIYENTLTHIKPTQTMLIGKPKKWDGLINELMWSLHLLDDDGESNDVAYGTKLKSSNSFVRATKSMRIAGILKPLEDTTHYELTDFGNEVGEYLSQFTTYEDMPMGAIVENKTITYGGLK